MWPFRPTNDPTAHSARGALALSGLSEFPDGRFADDMKRALPDGHKHLLIPPTYANVPRFHGVFGPTSRLRELCPGV